jgi:hypothetical protein
VDPPVTTTASPIPEGHDGGLTDFHRRQRSLSDRWESFGDIVKDYLGIPYKAKAVRPGQKGGGRAVTSLTGKPMGVATREVGLVCTSFVDVVLSRYVFHGPDDQLRSYKLTGDPSTDADDFTDVFHKRGLRTLHADVEPDALPSMGLDKRRIYGIAFYSRDGYTKANGKERGPGSVFHVGFLAFRNERLLLIHASRLRGKHKGVHIIGWPSFLKQCGNRLEGFAAGQVPGPKFVGVYALRPGHPDPH